MQLISLVYHLDHSLPCSPRSVFAGSRLVLRHRRPVSYPYPNAFSHPLPHFWYSASTKQIHIRFLCDPAFPQLDPSLPAPTAWQQKRYLLSSVPIRKPRTFLDDAVDAFSSITFTSNPLSPLQSIFSLPTSKSQADDVHDSNIDLREDELMEEDRGENEEADDSPELMRRIRVVSIDDPRESTTEATKLRRTFDVVPLRIARATYSR